MTYYVADEISGAWRGMEIAIPEPYWRETFGPMSVSELAETLVRLAQAVRLSRFQKQPRGKKKPPPKRTGAKPHFATAEILAHRKRRK